MSTVLEAQSSLGTAASTAKVNADDERIDRLKELYRSTPMQLDFERIRIMEDVYKDTVGYQQILRRAKFLAAVLERKKLYIDDNLFVGAMAGSLNAIYTHPEWNVEWMKEEKTVENSKTPEDRKANEWALDYWDKRSLKPRTEEIFERRYGFSAVPSYQAGLIAAFHDWPGGGGNLNYPMVYQQGLASVIKDVEERQLDMEMRLPNAPKFYFYEASLIVMRAVIRFAHRYAELAREMAAKEKDKTRKAELIALAETCEWVPEHPARNLREAMQSHFFCHIIAELEQVGCGYSEAYLGQNLEPYFQADKAAGLIDYDDAVFMFKNLTIKLNEINYYYGEKVALQNSADLGQSITLAGYTEDGGDATAEMDYVILDACDIPVTAPASVVCSAHRKNAGQSSSKKPSIVIGTGVGMPQFVNADIMLKRALYLWGHTERNAAIFPWARPGAPVSGRVWEATSRTRQVTRWKDSPTSARRSS